MSEAWQKLEAEVLYEMARRGPMALHALLYALDDPQTDRRAIPPAAELRRAARRLAGAALITVTASGELAATLEAKELVAAVPFAYGPDMVERILERLRHEVPVAAEGPAVTLTDEDYAEGLVACRVRQYEELRRPGKGSRKWYEWRQSPPLELEECFEFLTSIVGDGVQVRVVTGHVGVQEQPDNRTPTTSWDEIGDTIFEVDAGVAPLRSSVSNHRVTLILRAVDIAEAPIPPDAPAVALSLVPERFVYGLFRSADGDDYFTLVLRFEDYSIIVTDPWVGGV